MELLNSVLLRLELWKLELWKLDLWKAELFKSELTSLISTTYLLGIAGVIANICWPLFKQRKHILLGQIMACVLMASHFYLLGAATGAVVMAVAGIQAALALPLENHPQFKRVYLLSVFLTPVVCWLSWQGIASVFSSLALLLFCMGNLQTMTLKLRLWLLACLGAWIVHNSLVLSYPGLVSNALALATSLLALKREWRQSFDKGNAEHQVATTSQPGQ
ncbi:YgjV family protein [Bacterioplanoides sp.]|uniref:YgjV family protein n=1 Tax=Bacterioplanoides sp. TaxID=2066072 RepID=UPI003B5A9890